MTLFYYIGMLMNHAGIKDGSFLTVIDDDDDEPWVNVVINIEEGYVFRFHPETLVTCANRCYRTIGDDVTFKSSSDEKPTIPKRPKKEPQPETNGHSEKAVTEEGAEPKGLKRSHPDDDGQPLKKVKTTDGASDDVVLIEDAGGAIIIGDD